MKAEVKKVVANVNVVVMKEFIDRYTGILHKPGEKTSMSTVRLREINRRCEYVKAEAKIDAENKASNTKK